MGAKAKANGEAKVKAEIGETRIHRALCKRTRLDEQTAPAAANAVQSQPAQSENLASGMATTVREQARPEASTGTMAEASTAAKVSMCAKAATKACPSRDSKKIGRPLRTR
jgi:hypothetical protein